MIKVDKANRVIATAKIVGNHEKTLSNALEVNSTPCIPFAFSPTPVIIITNAVIEQTKIVSTTPLVMKLISQKKISLNHKVKQFFPNFEGTYKDQITIKDLLTHTSGINSYYEYFMDSPVKSYNEI